MRIFLSYKYTGENPDELKPLITNITKILEKSGYEVFCSFFKGDFFKKNSFTSEQILNYAFNELDKAQVYLAVIKSNEKSEGMFLEAGYALANKKTIVVAIKKGVETSFLKDVAYKVIEFDDLADLYKQLEYLDVN
jgi:hypothetical protein